MSLRTIHLHGALGEQFGTGYRLDVASVGEAARALEANFPGRFFNAIKGGQFHIAAFAVPEREAYLDADTLGMHLSANKDIHFIPAVEGSGGGGRGKGIAVAVIGIAIMAAAIAFAPAVVGAMGPTMGMGTTAFSIGSMGVSFTQIAMFGASLALSGISQALTPTPKVDEGSYGQREGPDQRPSFLFNGAVNTVEQGGAVAVCYGRMRVGSAVVSASLSPEDINT